VTEEAEDGRTLDRLFAVIESRRDRAPKSSYTAKLLAEGRDHIARKLGEEAVETVIAAMGNDKQQVVAESADLIYHLLVLWAQSNVRPEDVWAELARRRSPAGRGNT
jgi:phosphoribosyl-ATP pyrophosphohydrolase